MIQNVVDLFRKDYNVEILEEPLDVLRARIEWVQRHEDRRGPCIYYGY